MNRIDERLKVAASKARKIHNELYSNPSGSDDVVIQYNTGFCDIVIQKEGLYAVGNKGLWSVDLTLPENENVGYFLHKVGRTEDELELAITAFNEFVNSNEVLKGMFINN